MWSTIRHLGLFGFGVCFKYNREQNTMQVTVHKVANEIYMRVEPVKANSTDGEISHLLIEMAEGIQKTLDEKL